MEAALNDTQCGFHAFCASVVFDCAIGFVNAI